MSRAVPRIFLVDDDPSVRKALVRLLGSAGYPVETFASAREYLAREPHDGPGCLILDLRMPEMTGLELQEALERGGHTLPIIFLSGHGDIPASVKAMKAGAVDFLTKPVDNGQLLAAVDHGLSLDAAARAGRAAKEAARASVARLTPRECQVCMSVAAGMLNKQIGFELGISEKTVKVHRARVMEKLGVGSVADLVRLVDRARDR